MLCTSDRESSTRTRSRGFSDTDSVLCSYLVEQGKLGLREATADEMRLVAQHKYARTHARQSLTVDTIR